MAETRINIVAAISEKDGGLGNKNILLWRIKDDLKRFKRLTSGHPVIMGRKTFESIGKPLPDRTNIVITRNKNFFAPGLTVTHSLEEALDKALKIDPEDFIIGGGEIYKEAINVADRLYLTLVRDFKPADVFFPEWGKFNKVLAKEEFVDKDTGIKFTHLTLEKQNAGGTE